MYLKQCLAGTIKPNSGNYMTDIFHELNPPQLEERCILKQIVNPVLLVLILSLVIAKFLHTMATSLHQEGLLITFFLLFMVDQKITAMEESLGQV